MPWASGVEMYLYLNKWSIRWVLLGFLSMPCSTGVAQRQLSQGSCRGCSKCSITDRNFFALCKPGYRLPCVYLGKSVSTHLGEQSKFTPQFILQQYIPVSISPFTSPKVGMIFKLWNITEIMCRHIRYLWPNWVTDVTFGFYDCSGCVCISQYKLWVPHRFCTLTVHTGICCNSLLKLFGFILGLASKLCFVACFIFVIPFFCFHWMCTVQDNSLVIKMWNNINIIMTLIQTCCMENLKALKFFPNS